MKLVASIFIGLHFFVSSILEASSTPPGNHADADKSAMVVRYINRGELDNRNAYKIALIHAALDITIPEFGIYRVEPYTVEPSPKRQLYLINEGEAINMLWASPGSINAEGDVIEIPVDILHGLLGYRVCMTTNTTKVQFDRIKTISDLRQLKIGQGAGWNDVNIYLHNQITPIEAPNFEGVIGMLAMNRFDCLPLGIDEISFIYRENKLKFPPLQIERNLMLYYNFPLYLYVSKKVPLLAQRISLGIHKLQQNGDFDKLFNDFVAQDLTDLHLSSRRIICLPSPFIKSNDTCQLKIPPELSKGNSQGSSSTQQ